MPSPSVSTSQIHLINPMINANGGSENRTLELFKLLSPHGDVCIWSEFSLDEALQKKVPIRRIRPYLFDFPKSGTLVFVGCYFRVGRWLRFTKPDRVIAVFNTPGMENLAQLRGYLSKSGLESKLEIVYAADWLRKKTGIDGPVQCSPVDLGRFKPGTQRGQLFSNKFVVGRLSRDVPEKHHPDDQALYKMLCESGAEVRIMGGQCLQKKLADSSTISLLSQGSVEPHLFLQNLDCFLYRTSPSFYEPHGRVVTEAMACGLPVVCGVDGGYAEFIEHGKNGFLFSNNKEAHEIVATLMGDEEYRREIGKAARLTAERIFSAEELKKVVEFYVH